MLLSSTALGSAPLPLAHRFSRLRPLARSILAGEVVFFVGAGFSLDSERLSAARLMQRLLLRLHALDAIQPPPPQPAGAEVTAFTQLSGVFPVADTLAKIGTNWSDVEHLAAHYYEVNAWICRIFGPLFQSAAKAYPADLGARLANAERQARAAVPKWLPAEEFNPIPQHWIEKACHAQTPKDVAEIGKLLFVETLGFLNEEVMRGEPYASPGKPHPKPRLFPRHHHLARFAREGFCPILLTTNFDLLLEAAYRESGFASARLAQPGPAASLSALQNFDVIASPRSFFERGKAFRTATILKIHGCAGRLRELESSGELDRQLRYLPQLVYTYREIQNWRDDSWAADYLRSLLRTRTMVFAGYSATDPVIHDTLRSIYEEMQRKRAEDGADATRAAPPAPAFFLAYSANDRTQAFHAGEILRAASLAVGGGDASRHEHTHYLRFRPLGKDQPAHPDVDELLGWTHHRIFRLQQWNAAKTELPALIARLYQRRPESEIRAVLYAFARLVACESRALRHSTSVAATHRQLHDALAWSDGFHPALRREWARSLLLTRFPGRPQPVAQLDRPRWYFPASERPPWTAWSAVVELALRNLGRLAWRIWSPVTPAPGHAPFATGVQATSALHPTVYLRQHPGATAPLLALSIRVRGFDRPGKRLPLPGHPVRRVAWLFHEDAVPWTQAKPVLPGAATAALPQARSLGPDEVRAQPEARHLWQLALADPDHPSAASLELARHLLPAWPAPTSL